MPIEVSKELQIEYFRFEKRGKSLFSPHKKYIEFDNIESLVEYLEGVEGNILVTLGSNNIPHFSELKNLKKFLF